MVPQDQDARSRLLKLVEQQALAVRTSYDVGLKKAPEQLNAAVQGLSVIRRCWIKQVNAEIQKPDSC